MSESQMGVLSLLPDINKSLFPFNVYILGIHVELYLKKGFHYKC